MNGGRDTVAFFAFLGYKHHGFAHLCCAPPTCPPHVPSLPAPEPLLPSRFFRRVEEGYRPNPYHSKTHAADVMQSFHVIIHRGGLAPGEEGTAAGKGWMGWSCQVCWRADGTADEPPCSTSTERFCCARVRHVYPPNTPLSRALAGPLGPADIDDLSLPHATGPLPP